MPRQHKSNRSLAKRVRVTSTGKVMKRKPHQNHFNAKDSGSAGLRKHGSVVAPFEFNKQFQKLLPSRDISS